MILVTGASGFIGSHLIQALIAEYGVDQVVALTSSAFPSVKSILHRDYNIDDSYLLDSGCEAVTTIIHAGAFTPKNLVEANDIVKSSNNINNTNKLLRQKLPNLKKVVFLSTIDVYENTHTTITEQTPVGPESLYGHSKFYCEGLVKTYCDHIEADYSILRIGHVYGPGEEKYKKLIPEVMRSILRNRPVKLWGDGQDRRSFIYISDVVKAVVNASKTLGVFGPINVVSDKSYSIKEIVDTAIKVSSLDVEIETVTSNYIRRDLIFNNLTLKKYLHEPEVDLYKGLKMEWIHMKESYEKNNL